MGYNTMASLNRMQFIVVVHSFTVSRTTNVIDHCETTNCMSMATWSQHACPQTVWSSQSQNVQHSVQTKIHTRVYIKVATYACEKRGSCNVLQHYGEEMSLIIFGGSGVDFWLGGGEVRSCTVSSKTSTFNRQVGVLR